MKLEKGMRVKHPGKGWGTVHKVFDELDFVEVQFDKLIGIGLDGIMRINAHTLRRQTFLEFCFQKSGFGNTEWGAFAVRMLGVLVFLGLGIFMPPDLTGAKGACYVGAGVIVFILVYGTVRNFRGKGA